MDVTVRNAKGRSRYELVLQGEVVAIADYTDHGDVVVLPHTEVVRHLRDQGLGAKLVRGALDDLKAQGKRIVPACWFVRDFIDENHEYAELVA